MKTKLFLGLLFLTSFLTYLIFIKFNRVDHIKVATKAAMNPIKCTSTNFLLGDIDSTKQVAPLFDNLGSHEFSISSEVKQAQIFFNQGLNLAFAFNHAESHRSFLEASRLDPSSAMALWGQAYVLGPNINDQLPDNERKQKAYAALQKSLGLLDEVEPIERALIKALSHRYSPDTLVDVKNLNISYMEAMSEVAKQYPDNADILTLYAASVMNTVPWDYWDEQGKPSPNVASAKQALEKAMKLNPNHPGAHHYYIHMVELPQPDLGVPSAERLADLMPGAGHMVHMPGHIYMRVGRYQEAVIANQQAILVDEDYISQCYSQGLYPLGYYPHNIHFLWSAASMMGNAQLSIDAAKKTAEKVSPSLLEGDRFMQNLAATPLLAYMRFGKWNEILTTPDPGDKYTYLKMVWNYSRGIAFVRKGNLKEAKEELSVLENRDKDLEQENLSKVAYEALAGEILAASGDLTAGIRHLRKAIKYEDELPYNEPAEWYIPVRQQLGVLLLEDNQFAEAEKTYREDLDYYPQNGWSLIGLYESLKGQNKLKLADEVKNDFDKAWQYADIKIDGSVL